MPPGHEDHRAAPLSMSLLDVTAESAATQVYLAALRLARPSRALLLAQGIPADVLDAALEVLHSRGLVHLDPGGALDVPPPMSAIPQHATDLERRAQQVRAAAHELTQVYYHARTRDHDPDNGVHLLHDLDEVDSQTAVLTAQALDEVVVSRGMTSSTARVMAAPIETQREPVIGLDTQPVRRRVVWDTAALEVPDAMDILRARAGAGEDQRYLPRVALSFLVVDRSTCLLEWTAAAASAADATASQTASDAPPAAAEDTPAPPPPVGLVAHTPGLVLALLTLFERMWELATPLNRGAAGEEVDRRDLTILRLMAAGVADASIARQTGVSQRTVERRIRSLMERLMAETRFQAGVQAVRRGWL